MLKQLSESKSRQLHTQKIISAFEELSRENLILLEEIKMLKNLLYGIDWDKTEKNK